jgi:hypothetical protein
MLASKFKESLDRQQRLRGNKESGQKGLSRWGREGLELLNEDRGDAGK